MLTADPSKPELPRDLELDLLQDLLVDIVRTLAHPAVPPHAKNAAIATMIDERAPWLIPEPGNLAADRNLDATTMPGFQPGGLLIVDDAFGSGELAGFGQNARVMYVREFSDLAASPPEVEPRDRNLHRNPNEMRST
jgi:hypothetical protein